LQLVLYHYLTLAEGAEVLEFRLAHAYHIMTAKKRDSPWMMKAMFSMDLFLNEDLDEKNIRTLFGEQGGVRAVVEQTAPSRLHVSQIRDQHVKAVRLVSSSRFRRAVVIDFSPSFAARIHYRQTPGNRYAISDGSRKQQVAVGSPTQVS